MSQPITFVHLSDLHLTRPGQLAHGLDSRRLVGQVLARVHHLADKPAWIVVSGELSDDASTASYEILNGIVGELEASGIPVLLALGNHDNRDVFRQIALGEGDAAGRTPYYYSKSVDGVRIVVLDSVIPGKDSGALDEPQLAWLETELHAPAPGGTLIVLHHPCRLAADTRHFPAFVLHNAAALEAIVARAPGRVLGVLAGHSHQANAALFAGTIHTTAAAVLCQLDFFAGETYAPIPGSGFNLCRIQDGELIVQPVFVGDG